MDAVAPLLIGIGIFLAYEAWTNEAPAPLQKFLNALGQNSSNPNAVSNSAPYTGPTTTTNIDGSTITLGSGTSVAGGGTDALHG